MPYGCRGAPDAGSGSALSHVEAVHQVIGDLDRPVLVDVDAETGMPKPDSRNRNALTAADPVIIVAVTASVPRASARGC
jgi:hypothetical protein